MTPIVHGFWHPSGHFDYSYAHIYQLNIEDFVVEIHHGDFFIFHFTRKQQKKAKASFHTDTVHRVERENLNFGLRVCRIFSCVKIKVCC